MRRWENFSDHVACQLRSWHIPEVRRWRGSATRSLPRARASRWMSLRRITCVATKISLRANNRSHEDQSGGGEGDRGDDGDCEAVAHGGALDARGIRAHLHKLA